MKPKELHASRQEYQEFPPKVFRKHIYQLRHGVVERGYWLNRKSVEMNQQQQ
jgi:hypothetical protein